MKNILIFIWPLIAFCLVEGYSQQTMDLKVLNPPQSVKPGGHFTLFVEASDFFHTHEDDGVTLELPENWQIILFRKSEINKTTSKFAYTVAIPSTTVAGTYNIHFSSVSTEGALSAVSVEIVVTSIRRIEIIPLSFYEFAKEGDTLQFTYLIQNLGNVA